MLKIKTSWPFSAQLTLRKPDCLPITHPPPSSKQVVRACISIFVCEATSASTVQRSVENTS